MANTEIPLETRKVRAGLGATLAIVSLFSLGSLTFKTQYDAITHPEERPVPYNFGNISTALRLQNELPWFQREIDMAQRHPDQTQHTYLGAIEVYNAKEDSLEHLKLNPEVRTALREENEREVRSGKHLLTSILWGLGSLIGLAGGIGVMYKNRF